VSPKVVATYQYQQYLFLIQRQNAVYLYSIEDVFGFCETLPAFQTLATLVLGAIKPLLKNPKSIFNSV
jgi:hypothetical protein